MTQGQGDWIIVLMLVLVMIAIHGQPTPQQLEAWRGVFWLCALVGGAGLLVWGVLWLVWAGLRGLIEWLDRMIYGRADH